MTFLWTLRDLKRAVGARSFGEDFDITGVSIDSRTVKKGDVFVALKNERDGHEFVKSAEENGAVAAVVEREIKDVNLHQIIVDDTFEALWAMAKAQRDWGSAKRIAITGSCGKTSTKELMAKGLNAHKSEGSYNNHWGVPLSMSRMSREALCAVFEVGMNHPGEIVPLSELVKPDIAVVTNVAPAHIGAFENEEAIAKEKLSIAAGLKSGGKLVTSYETYEKYQHLFKEKPVTYSIETADPADVVMEARNESRSGQTVAARVFDKRVSFHMPLTGEHQALNALCVMAVAYLLDEDVERVALRLESAEAVAGRGKVYDVDGIRVVDESYNANPKSMVQSINNFKGLADTKRHVAILGQMAELGEASADYHIKLAKHLDGLDTLVLVGEHMKPLFDILPKDMDKYYFATGKEINLQKLCTQLEVGDSLMVKGSNGVFWKYGFVNKLIAHVRQYSQKM